MSKTLLFVQSAGDARPKCVRQTVPLVVRLLGAPEVNGWAAGYATKFEAERWWLVECENAAHGREAISPRCGKPGCTLSGARILASGGKR